MSFHIFNKDTSIELEDSQELLGIRGSLLMELASLSLPLAPGFILDSKFIRNFNSKELDAFVKTGLKSIKEKGIIQTFGDNHEKPVLLKVVLSPSIQLKSSRSLHGVGLNSETTEAFSQLCGEDFAYGEYEYLIYRFSTEYLGVEKSKFDEAKKKLAKKSNKEICEYYLNEIVSDFPQNVDEQLSIAIEGLTANYYKDELNKDIAAAVIVQLMTYGNLGENSYNGSYTSRNIVTGGKKIQGFFGRNQFWTESEEAKPIEKIASNFLNEFETIASKLEQYFKDIREVKFTIEEGKIWIVEQKKVQNKSTQAELRTLLDLHKEGRITQDYLISQFSPKQLNDLLHPIVSPSQKNQSSKIEGGIAGSPGAAVGKVYFSTKALNEAYRDAVANNEDSRMILAMESTYAGDVQAIEIGQGVVSSEGGYSSHAPVVARSLGKPAIVNPEISFSSGSMKVNGQTINEGDYITIEVPTYDSPSIYKDKLDLEYPDLEKNGLVELMDHSKDYIKDFKILTNADTPRDAGVAKKLGAEGIGLCRTEHMFFDAGRINLFRALLVSSSLDERRSVLEKLQQFQTEDFYSLFEVMNEKTVTIRLLDAPLHEFIPANKDQLDSAFKEIKELGFNVTKKDLEKRFSRLHESNPMLGHRGSRLAVTYPEIYEMQVRAILEASLKASKKSITPKPEIMLPLIMRASELQFLIYGRNIEDAKVKGIQDVIEETLKNHDLKEFPFEYKIGSMIELPSAAISAGQLAKYAQFFSFGTNDLTQTTTGISRDDVNSFLPDYTKYDIFQENPFQVLTVPVRELISLATLSGKMTRPDLKLGLCGEHGTLEENIQFCIETGLNYVSCSPYGVPLATLAVARYNLEHKSN